MAYFSNSTAGDAFDAQCGACPLGAGTGEHGCPVALVQLMFNYDQVGNDVAEKILGILVSDKTLCAVYPLAKKLTHNDEADENQLSLAAFMAQNVKGE
jgi:hypothetical protein